jgi:hypothetical protein
MQNWLMTSADSDHYNSAYSAHKMMPTSISYAQQAYPSRNYEGPQQNMTEGGILYPSR